MSEDKTKTGAAGAPPEETKAPGKEPKFTLARLRSDCYAIFGVTTSTFDGATYGLTGEYTVDGMKAVIEKWQKKQVLPAEQKEDKV